MTPDAAARSVAAAADRWMLSDPSHSTLAPDLYRAVTEYRSAADGALVAPAGECGYCDRRRAANATVQRKRRGKT